MCTSSMRYTLNRPRVGAYWTLSSSSRVSSTFVRDAASTSMRSTNRPSSMAVHAEHTPQGSATIPVSQFSAFASRRATVVLPMPRVPVNRYAWCSRLSASEFASA